jgi:hypothetical protein
MTSDSPASESPLQESPETGITIQLSADEAFVLFELLARFDQTDKLQLKSNAEFVVLSRVHGQLEKALVVPFHRRYREFLEDARKRLAATYEGLAPGVEPETP